MRRNGDSRACNFCIFDVYDFQISIRARNVDQHLPTQSGQRTLHQFNDGEYMHRRIVNG